MTNRIGKYEIQADLARGGFGRVYRAFDPTVGRLVAVKVLAVEADRDLLTRFRQEATAAGNLHHRNIVTIYEYGEHNDAPFIAMEFLEGRNLQDIIASRQPLTILQKMNIMAQVAEGLKCAHQNGIIHRDVKPANIMVLPDGTAKIMDFGIARLTRENAARLTQRGDLLGTLLYMSPEQYRVTEVDTLCDIFSYGVIYYEFLTGKHPFEAKDAASLMYRITSEEPEPITHIIPECPDTLERVVRRAMAKERELRYQSLEDLQFDAAPIRIEFQRDHAATLLAEAQDLFSSGQFDAAHSKVRASLELDPSNRVARELRSSIQEQTQRIALRSRVAALLEQGDACLAQHRYADALEAFESGLRLDRDNTEAQSRAERARNLVELNKRVSRLLTEANQALERQDVTSANQTVSELLRVDPGNVEGNLLSAKVKEELERREAERKLKEGLSKARGLLLISEFDRALSILDELKRDFPDSQPVLELHVRASVLKTDNERRETLRRELTAIRGLLSQGSFEEVITRAESLLPEYPGDKELPNLIHHAREELRFKQRAEALEQLNAEVRVLAERREFQKAIEALERGVRLFPEETDLVDLLQQYKRLEALQSAIAKARRLIEERHPEEALELLQPFAAEFPQDIEISTLSENAQQVLLERQRQAQIQEQLAQAAELVRTGEWGPAVHLLESAVERYPDAADLPVALERARAGLRHVEEENEVARQIRVIEQKVSGKSWTEALKLTQAAQTKFGGRQEFDQLLKSVSAGRAEQEKLLSIQAVLRRVARLEEEHNLDAALAELDAAVVQYPDSAELSQQVARLRAKILEEDRQALISQRVAAIQEKIGGGILAEALDLIRVAQGEFGDLPVLATLRQQIQQEQEREEKKRASLLAKALHEVSRLEQKGEFVAALQLIEQTRLQFPQSTGLMQAQTRLQELRKKSIETVRLQQRQQELAGLVKTTREKLKAEDFEAARNILEQGLKSFPNEQQLLDLRQELLAEESRRKTLLEVTQLAARSQFDSARKALRPLLRKNPADPEALALQTAIDERTPRQETQSAWELYRKPAFAGGAVILTAVLAMGILVLRDKPAVGTRLPAISTSSLPRGRVGYPYNEQVTIAGGRAPYSWTIKPDSLPPGLTFDLSSGLLHGTPSQQGLYEFSMKVSDSDGKASETSTLKIKVDPKAIETAVATPPQVPSNPEPQVQAPVVPPKEQKPNPMPRAETRKPESHQQKSEPVVTKAETNPPPTPVRPPEQETHVQPVEPALPTQLNGRLEWSSGPGESGRISIDGSAKSASSGFVRGDPLPGVPVRVTVRGGKVSVVEQPSPSNKWSRFSVECSATVQRFSILWEVIPRNKP